MCLSEGYIVMSLCDRVLYVWECEAWGILHRMFTVLHTVAVLACMVPWALKKSDFSSDI